MPPRSRRAELAVLTGAKAVANAALRWVGPFLPTLERAFGASTGTLTGIIGVAELGGLSTTATGPLLDRGHERRIFVLGLVAVVASCVVALGGSIATFAVSYTILVLGVSNLTVAGHTWIGHRVDYSSRGRAIGAFEMSWAIALLVGAPLLALLIDRAGWRGPYVALAIAGAAAAVAVVALVSPGVASASSGQVADRGPIPRAAWFPVVASASTAASGLGVFVVSGAWLDESHGISTAGLGLIAAAFGAVELLSSSAVVAVSDRVGARRSVFWGLVVLGCGIAVMATSGDSAVRAVAGLLIFLVGFEYAFVCSITLVSEAAPNARGRLIGTSSAVGTIARSAAVICSGQLFENFGFAGSLVQVAATTAVAFGCTVASPRR